MATITGTEAIIRNGKIIGSPTATIAPDRVVVTDSNGARVGSDVTGTKLSQLGNTFSIVNGKVCITYDDGQ